MFKDHLSNDVCLFGARYTSIQTHPKHRMSMRPLGICFTSVEEVNRNYSNYLIMCL